MRDLLASLSPSARAALEEDDTTIGAVLEALREELDDDAVHRAVEALASEEG